MKTQNIAILLEDFVEDVEFVYPFYRFKEEGYNVDILAPKIGEFKGKKGLTFHSSHQVDYDRVNEYIALFIPGGYAPDKLRRDNDVILFVQTLYNKGKLVAAICHAPWVLITAKIIDGKKVEVDIKREKKNIVEAQLKRVLEKSPFRREPLCKYFTVCGGCDFQHIDYNHQIDTKKENLEESLRRIGRIEHIPIIKTVPSEKEFFHRNRAQFKIYGSSIGFYKRESHTVTDIDSCPLLLEDISYLPIRIRPVLSLFMLQPSELHVFSSKNETLLKLIFPKKPKSIPVSLKSIRKFTGLNIKGIGIYYRKGNDTKLERALGDKYLYYKVGDFKFRVSMDSFFQVNHYQINRLIKIVSKSVSGSKILADMYCGVGTLTIPSSKKAEKVFGFEINRFAVRDAMENARINGAENVEFFSYETKKATDFIVERGIKVDTVIFDPPRTDLNEYIIEKISSVTSSRL